MPLNIKRLLITSIISYYLKKTIKNFDVKVLNDSVQKDLHICQKCGRLIDDKVFLDFSLIPCCPFCNQKFLPIEDSIVDNNMNKNTNKILSL